MGALAGNADFSEGRNTCVHVGGNLDFSEVAIKAAGNVGSGKRTFTKCVFLRDVFMAIARPP